MCFGRVDSVTKVCRKGQLGCEVFIVLRIRKECEKGVDDECCGTRNSRNTYIFKLHARCDHDITHLFFSIPISGKQEILLAAQQPRHPMGVMPWVRKTNSLALALDLGIIYIMLV